MDVKGYQLIQEKVLGSLGDVTEPAEGEDLKYVCIESTATRDAAYILNLLDDGGFLHDSYTRRLGYPNLELQGMSTRTAGHTGTTHTTLLFKDLNAQPSSSS